MVIGTIATGNWPSTRDTWEYICSEFDTKSRPLGSFSIYVGYPMQNTKGNIQVTGISVTHGFEVQGPVVGVLWQD